MARTTPRQIANLLLQLGTDALAQTLDPEGLLSYTVDDLTLYLPSRRTRIAQRLNSVPTAIGRFTTVEIAGISNGGTWVEHLSITPGSGSAVLHLNDPSIGTRITNELTAGLEFGDPTLLIDEVFLTGLYQASYDVLPWSQQLTGGSIVSQGTSTIAVGIQWPWVLDPGIDFPSVPFWIPPNWRLAIQRPVANSGFVLNYVLTLPPLGVIP